MTTQTQVRSTVEALKHEINLVLTDPDTNLSHGAKRALDYVLGQLEALAQPKRDLKPKCFADFQPNHEHERKCQWCAVETECKTGVAQPEHEPVAFLTNRRQRLNVEFNATGLTLMPKSVDWKIPLYTTPPRCPNCDSLKRQNAELDLRLAEQDQAPFGFLTNKRQRFNFEPNATGLSNMPMTIDWKIPLYGSPQPQRKPLTRAVLWKLWCDAKFESAGFFWLVFARAIEAAHGIKE